MGKFDSPESRSLSLRTQQGSAKGLQNKYYHIRSLGRYWTGTSLQLRLMGESF